MNSESLDRTSALVDASLLGKFDRVSQLLNSGVEINLKDHKGWTAMHFAAAAGYTDIVELLLARGADVNSTTNKNESCLLLAVLSGHIYIVRVLVSAGADVNLQRDDGVSPLHAASQRKYSDVVKIMMDRVAQVDITADDDSTPLASGEPDPGQLWITIKKKNESSVMKYWLEVLINLAHAFLLATEGSSQHNNSISQLHERKFTALKEFLKVKDVLLKTMFTSFVHFCHEIMMQQT